MEKLILNYLNEELKTKDPQFDLTSWIEGINQKKNPENKLNLKLFENKYGRYLDVWGPNEELIVRFHEKNILDSRSLAVILLDALKKIYEYSIYSDQSQFDSKEMDIIFEDLKSFSQEVHLNQDPYFMEKLNNLGRMI